MTIRFTVFLHKQDVVPNPKSLSWEGLVDLLGQRETRESKDGPLWSPAVYAEGSTRGNKNVVEITCAVFDLDHLDIRDVEVTEQALQASGLAYVLYSTHTHTPPDDCRLRAVVPVSRPVKPSEWPLLRARMADLLKLKADPQAKEVARMFYLPSAPPNPEHEPLFESCPGKAIDVDYVLGQKATAATPKDPGSSTGTVDMFALRAELRKVRKPESKSLIKKILAGEALATENRDATMFQAASVLAFALPVSTPVEACVEILRPSIQAMPSEHPLDFELDKVREKLERALEDRRKQIAENLAFQESRLAKKAPPGSQPPTETEATEDLLTWANSQRCTPDELLTRWVIQKGNAYYVFVDGRYRPPLTENELEGSLPRDLARSPIDMIRFDAKGNPRQAKVGEVLADHRTVARALEASMTLQESYYDPETETFHEAVCPVRKIASNFHPQVDAWLRLLGGKDADKLLDWVASVTILDKQCAALFLMGEAGAGKGLLAGGLARIWNTGGPTEFASLVSGFNEAVAACPLVLCDEGLPKRRDYSANDELRRWIGSSERTLNRKFMPAAKLGGCIRLLIAANNDRILDGIEEMSEADRVAITQRLLCVTVGMEPRAYVEGLPRAELQSWMEHKIAEHALWLRDNRVVVPGSRFLVEGFSTDMHDQLSVNNGLAPAVCEFLVNTIMQLNPASAKTLKDVLVVGDGKVLVSSRAFSDELRWKMLVPGTRFPDTKSLYRTLSNMRIRQVRVRLDDGTQPSFNLIKHDLLLTWAKLNGVGDVDAMLAKISAPLPAP